MNKKQVNQWERIQWSGNYECYRKEFGRGHVSVGIGSFSTICFSYGANSEHSLSSTRWYYGFELTERQAMEIIDICDGHYDNKKWSAYCEKLFPGAKSKWYEQKNVKL